MVAIIALAVVLRKKTISVQAASTGTAGGEHVDQHIDFCRDHHAPGYGDR
jgi:hypothetical protein